MFRQDILISEMSLVSLLLPEHHLVGLEVKASAPGVEDPEFDSLHAPCGFFQVESY